MKNRYDFSKGKRGRVLQPEPEPEGKTRVTTILFYPGSIDGTTGLRFMGLKDRDALGNYRVKIYG